LDAQPGGLLDWHERAAIPIEQPGRYGQAHATPIAEPVDIGPADAHGLAPFVLHPLGAFERPVTVSPMALVTRVFRFETVVDCRERLMARNKRGGRHGHNREVSIRGGADALRLHAGDDASSRAKEEQ